MITTTTTTTTTTTSAESKINSNNNSKPQRIVLPDNSLLSPHYNNLNRSFEKRPILHPHHSFDALDQYSLNKSANIVIEPVTFRIDYSNNKKSDTKSVRSGSSSSRMKKFSKKSMHISLTDIFANNLSKAVSDVDDSNEDGYVYAKTPPILQGVNFEYFSDTTAKRPRLRSTLSELAPNTSKVMHLYKHHSFDEDEENFPLLYKRKERNSLFMQLIKNPKIISWLTIISAIICLCMMLF